MTRGWSLSLFCLIIAGLFASIQCPRPLDPKYDLAPKLWIGSFNVQVLGQSKSEKAVIMKMLVKIITQYDIIAVLEIRDSEHTAVARLLDQVNRASVGVPYNYIISIRAGSSSMQEQCAYFYRVNSVEPESQDKIDSVSFERPPFAAYFRSIRNPKFKFALLAVHLIPNREKLYKELNALKNLYWMTVKKFHNEISFAAMLGDFNADCLYMNKESWAATKMYMDPAYTWLIPTGTKTNSHGDTSCAYDRVVLSNVFGDSVIPNSNGVFHYENEFAMGKTVPKDYSDHFPIEFAIFEKVNPVVYPDAKDFVSSGPHTPLMLDWIKPPLYVDNAMEEAKILARAMKLASKKGKVFTVAVVPDPASSSQSSVKVPAARQRNADGVKPAIQPMPSDGTKTAAVRQRKPSVAAASRPKKQSDMEEAWTPSDEELESKPKSRTQPRSKPRAKPVSPSDVEPETKPKSRAKPKAKPSTVNSVASVPHERLPSRPARKGSKATKEAIITPPVVPPVEPITSRWFPGFSWFSSRKPAAVVETDKEADLSAPRKSLPEPTKPNSPAKRKRPVVEYRESDDEEDDEVEDDDDDTEDYEFEEDQDDSDEEFFNRIVSSRVRNFAPAKAEAKNAHGSTSKAKKSSPITSKPRVEARKPSKKRKTVDSGWFPSTNFADSDDDE